MQSHDRVTFSIKCKHGIYCIHSLPKKSLTLCCVEVSSSNNLLDLIRYTIQRHAVCFSESLLLVKYLLQPFWPTGSGCARGFLGAFDAAWMMKRFSAGVDPIDLLKQREAILTLLPQTSPSTLQKDITKYTIDPRTRYYNVDCLVTSGDVSYLYDTCDDDIVAVDQTENGSQAENEDLTTTGINKHNTPPDSDKTVESDSNQE